MKQALCTHAYYMRDDHTFVKLPLDNIEAALAIMHKEIVNDRYNYGMLCGWTDNNAIDEVVHCWGNWLRFSGYAKDWLTKYTLKR